MDWKDSMNLFGFFRRMPPIGDTRALADFIDEHSAFIVQKGIYDYTQARAGHYTKVLLKEQEFIETFERARWQAYPLGLAMIGELVAGVLHPHAVDDRRALIEALLVLVLSVFDRYPVPPLLGSERWQKSRAELASKLAQIGTHPPKRTIDIPVPYAQRYFDLMPFHKDLLTRDMPTARSYLQINLTNIRDELIKRMDAPAMARSLRAFDMNTAGSS
jgi:hypothetical protein